MALFTDGSISTLEDLRAYESAIFDVASTERIDLSKKQVLAQEELETELNSHLRQQREEVELTQVVVTKPLRQWHVFRSLALTYRDAYNSHLNDRYQGKWKEYDRLASWAQRKLLETGLGIVAAPMAKAATPAVRATVGSLPAGTYWVRVAWTDAGGAEGCASDPANLPVEAGSGLVVSAKKPPENATGWNVYVGTAPEETQRQNEQPIGVGTEWQMPDRGLVEGALAGEGQPADSFLTQRRVLQRG
jgi:hypothetical protein